MSILCTGNYFLFSISESSREEELKNMIHDLRSESLQKSCVAETETHVLLNELSALKNQVSRITTERDMLQNENRSLVVQSTKNNRHNYAEKFPKIFHEQVSESLTDESNIITVNEQPIQLGSASTNTSELIKGV